MLTMSAQVDRGSLIQAISALGAYARAQGITVRHVCYDVMRTWLIDVIRQTAPWAGRGRLGSFAEQRTTGQQAVAHDIDRAFAKLKNPANSWERGGKRFVKLESGAVITVPPELWRPSMAAYHASVRNHRGRVPRQARQAWVHESEFNSYVSAVQSRVGLLKAGWVPALEHYAALSRGGTGRVPQWVLRLSRGGASYGGNMQDTGTGTIWAANTAPHSSAIRAGSIDYTRRRAEAGIVRHARQRIQQIADRFNSGRIPQPIIGEAA